MKEKKNTTYKKYYPLSKSPSAFKTNINKIKVNNTNKIRKKKYTSLIDLNSQMGEMNSYIEELYKKYKDTKKQRQIKEQNEQNLINRINYLTAEEKKMRMNIEKNMKKYKNKSKKSLSTTNLNYDTFSCNTMNNYKKNSTFSNSYIENDNNSVDLLNNSGSLVTNNICIIINRDNNKNNTKNNYDNIMDESAIITKKPIKIFRKKRVKCPSSLIYDMNLEKNIEKTEEIKISILEDEKDDISKNYNSNREIDEENKSPIRKLYKKMNLNKSVTHSNYYSPSKMRTYKKNNTKNLRSFIHKKIPLFTKVHKKQKTNSVKLNSSDKKYFERFTTNTSKRNILNKKIGTFKQLIDSKKNLLGLKTNLNCNLFKELSSNFSYDKQKENFDHIRNISLDNSCLKDKLLFKTNDSKDNTNKNLETGREETLKLNPTIFYSPDTSKDNSKKIQPISVRRVQNNKVKKINNIIPNRFKKNNNDVINNGKRNPNKKVIIQNFFINANNNKVGNNNKIMDNKLLINPSVNEVMNPNFVKDEISIIRRINLKLENMKKNNLLNKDNKNSNKIGNKKFSFAK